MATGLIQPFMYYLAIFLWSPSWVCSLSLALSLSLSLPLSVWMCCLWAIIRVDRLVGGSLWSRRPLSSFYLLIIFCFLCACLILCLQLCVFLCICLVCICLMFHSFRKFVHAMFIFLVGRKKHDFSGVRSHNVCIFFHGIVCKCVYVCACVCEVVRQGQPAIYRDHVLL